MIILKTENLNKVYQTNSRLNHVVSDCNIEVGYGEFVAITGLKGCGKSTLLRLLGGLDKPTSGKVLLKERDLYSLDSQEMQILYRKRIGMILQDYQLISGLTVYENIVMPVLISHGLPESGYLRELTDSLHISGVLHRYPKNLTKEQRQCTAIARALVNQPEIILADDPTKNLNKELAKDILDLLMNYISWYRRTLIIATQDPDIIIFADHVIHLNMGRVVTDRKIRRQQSGVRIKQLSNLNINRMIIKQ